MCQKDSYLKHLQTKVVSCSPGKCKIEQVGGDVVKSEGFYVELEDTILFPEGGGQPCDYGMINNCSVRKVMRKAATALHFVQSSFEVGEIVELSVDWERRFDHMQQHSAQHLITAITDKTYGYATTSWDLGKSVSFIELGASEVQEAEVVHIEKLVNEAIRSHIPVSVHVTYVGSPLLNSVRTRGLPTDHVGDVRVVKIEGIEANMCCGTHVSNLSHLQCVKLLSAEKGKKGKTNLYFLAGDRVLAHAQKHYYFGKEITKHLKCGPDQHVAAIERSMKQLKLAQKNCMNLLRDVAILEANSFKQSFHKAVDNVLVLHRKEGTVEFMNIVANEVSQSCEAYMFITVGDEKGQGMFLLHGPGTFIEECGLKVAETICGKAFTKGGRMQGKAEKLQNREEALALIKDYIESHQIA